jgi:transposase
MYLNIGIDVSKNKHDACILNEKGEQIGKFMKLTNTKTSLDKFLEQIKIISEKHDAKLRIGLEATGIYWYSLFSKISEDHKISIYNPMQIHAFAKVNVRGSKTDKIDAKTIANMLRFGNAPQTNYSDRQRLELREYVRFYLKLTSKKTNLKKRFRRNLHLVFPGYDQVFKNVFTKTSKEILSQSPTPDDILEMGEAKLLELMKKASKNHIDKEKARELIAKAEDTIPSEILKESSLFELQIMLDMIENIEKHLLALENRIFAIWEKVKDKHYIQTIPGISEFRAAMIWAEIGDIENFKHPDQIVAFAGLDPKVRKSANKEVIGGPNKRGSSTLRWALGWAVQESKNVNPVLAPYFKKKIAEGKHYNTARCAASKKLIRIIWSVEKNKKPFQVPDNLQSS